MRRLRRPGRLVTVRAQRPLRLSAPEERWARLLEATRQLLAERGPDKVSVEAIASRAGVAKGTFYLYFSSRDQLLDSVRERWIDEIVSEANGQPELSGPEGWPARLRALVELMVDLLLRDPPLHLTLLHPPARAGQPVSALGTLEGLVERSIREARAVGVPDLPEPWLAAALLVHGIHGVVDRYLQAQVGVAERARLVDEITQLAERLLGPIEDRGPAAGPEAAPPTSAGRGRRSVQVPPPPDPGTPR
ncbi:MAG TPA: helix-turn-helix domain-containing protein [Candidatus Dormibacteraeota bacterium]|nr:helix-turn-helix domain-containing protein [Candidatus Dormibacteraeota bacterium]